MSISAHKQRNLTAGRLSTRTKTWLFVAGAALIAFVAASLWLASHFTPAVRERAVTLLGERFDSDVEFSSFTVSVYPGLGVTGGGMTLRRHGSTVAQPLIFIKKFSADAGLLQFLGKSTHVRRVYVDGLVINVPLRGERGNYRSPHPTRGKKPAGYPAIIDELVCKNAQVNIMRREPGKEPLTIDIHKLTMEAVGPDGPSPFHATLTNPKPRGEVETDGSFGPWDTDEPRLTPLSASYSFKDADLGTFRRISGTLSSTGKFGGVLERIEADGVTDTPNFTLEASGHPLPLHAEYHAIIDGTSGNTYLQPVHATFLHSSVTATGAVTGTPGVKGKTISLDATMDKGRIEDVLTLASKPEPAMTGAMTFRSKIEIPRGDRKVQKRLILNGTFSVADAHFTKFDIQQKINMLSQRALGHPGEQEQGSVVSNLKGEFSMRDGVVSFSNLTFGVRGALVQLHGQYDVANDLLDFHGKLLLEAKLSQTVTGWKSVLLKAVDPFLQKDGKGAVLPIKVTGSKKAPSFGLDLF